MKTIFALLAAIMLFTAPVNATGYGNGGGDNGGGDNGGGEAPSVGVGGEGGAACDERVRMPMGQSCGRKKPRKSLFSR